METILLTGSCGFIGSNFVRYLLETDPSVAVVNLDLLTYAGNPANLAGLEGHPRYRFVRATWPTPRRHPGVGCATSAGPCACALPDAGPRCMP
jgi:hypothetical protein